MTKPQGKDVAKSRDTIQKPHDIEKATSAAYLRLMGATQEQAGKAVGVARQTVVKWEASDFWPSAVETAKSRWLAGLAAKARASVETAIPDDARLAFSVLERLEPALNPKATVQVEGGAQPVRIEVTRKVVK